MTTVILLQSFVTRKFPIFRTIHEFMTVNQNCRLLWLICVEYLVLERCPENVEGAFGAHRRGLLIRLGGIGAEHILPAFHLGCHNTCKEMNTPCVLLWIWNVRLVANQAELGTAIQQPFKVPKRELDFNGINIETKSIVAPRQTRKRTFGKCLFVKEKFTVPLIWTKQDSVQKMYVYSRNLQRKRTRILARGFWT